MTQAFPQLPVPSNTTVTQTWGQGGSDQTSPIDPELMYSMQGYTQKGVTLAGGQGILPIGTVLARNTSTKKYYAYNNGGSNGLDTARGVLRRAVDTGGEGAPDQFGNMVIMGILKNDLVSGADGGAVTDLGARVDTARNTFRF